MDPSPAPSGKLHREGVGQDAETLPAIQAVSRHGFCSGWRKWNPGIVGTCGQSHRAPDLCRSLWDPHRPWAVCSGATGALPPCKALGSQRDGAEGAPCCSTPPYPLSLLQLQINTRGGGSPRGTPPTAGCDPAQCGLLGRSTINRCKSHPEAHVLRVPSAKSRLQRRSTKSYLARPRGQEQGLAGLTPAANRTCIY